MTEARFALAQINTTVGDLGGNREKILRAAAAARGRADAIIFPELAVSGYPPEDLLLRGDFLRACERSLAQIKKAARGIDVIVGHPLLEGEKVYNALSLLRGGKTRALYRKRCLPNYAVFDEKRYFHAGNEACVAEIKGLRAGFCICEDIWRDDAARESAKRGADLLVCINASPFHNEQMFAREEGVVRKKARRHKLPVIYLNQVGGQDELVFDGSSLAVNAGGEVAARLPAFEEAIQVAVFRRGAFECAAPAERPEGAELIYRALVAGVRDYIRKNNFRGVALGLSGGVDSAVTLAIAADAIGAKRVLAVMMPSRHTAAMSIEDARAQAAAFGARFEKISIEPLYRAALRQLAPLFAGRAPGTAEENLQARCRGMLLMALSNKFGYMLLNTGNKSEMAVGYATLYGDMAGGFSALKDVPKEMVYQLARYRNRAAGREIIPRRVIERAPSAELAPNQKDEDTLPPYAALDPILEAFVRDDRAAEEIIADGFDADSVHRVVKMVAANEYKRRQSPPGVRVTSRAFGKDRRYPITSRFFRG
ncbi:MAG: NAD+ synthase [Gammaproteobacteria bacterium]|nr:NAD+ synthase [Gammaproteobacteria bacterium]MDA7970789.1 NAD+ synthase [Gammaproteobacteria bacterium]CAJ2377550.1 MAG: Glutamine-dependent NAD(+) synthetase [Arenicellales bacterium IbO2]